MGRRIIDPADTRKVISEGIVLRIITLIVNEDGCLPGVSLPTDAWAIASVSARRQVENAKEVKVGTR